MRRIVFFLLWFLATCCGSIAVAQGFKTDSLFQHFDADHVNVSDLTSVVRIPLFSWAQRGSSPPLEFVLNANTPMWYPQVNCLDAGHCQYFYNHDQPLPTSDGFPNLGGFGPSFLPVGIPYVITKNYTFQDPGSAWWSYDKSYVIDDSGASHQLWVDAGNAGSSRTVDGSGYLDDSTGLKDSLGRTITTSWSAPPSTNTVTDNDGNVISWTYNSNQTVTWTDTVGRSLTFGWNSFSSNTSGCPTPPVNEPLPVAKLLMTVPGYSAPLMICSANVNINTNFFGNGPGQSVSQTMSGGCAGDPGCPAYFVIDFLETSKTVQPIQSVTLPDGRVWMFLYDSAPDNTTNEAYGEIKRIIEPTKGSIWYCYKHDWLKPGNPPGRWGSGTPLSIYLSERVIDSDPNAPNYQCGSSTSANGRSIWHYEVGPDSVGYTNTVTDPQGNDEVASYVPGTIYSQYNTNTRTESYYLHSGNSRQLMKSVTESSQGKRLPVSGDSAEQFSFVNRDSTTTTNVDNVTTETDSQGYDSSFQPAIKVCGLGPDNNFCQYKTSVATGIGQVTSTSNGIQTQATVYKWSTDTNFSAANFINAVQSQTTSDASSSSETDYAYDEPSYYGGTGKGHLTGITKVNDSGSNVTTHTHYDSYGMPDIQYDGKNHSTTTTYDATYHVYPISVTKGGLSDGYSYNLDTGAVLSHTDANNQVTQFGYDSGGRPITVQTPGLSSGHYSTTICYPDSNTARVFQAQATSISSPSSDGTTCGSSASDTVIKTFKADGLGRTVRSSLDSAPGGAVQSDTSYDAWGRVTFTSIPYLATSSTSIGTSTHYDAIGRVSEVDTPTGVKTWAYSGFTSKLTDELQNRRWTTTDALGRITSVLEPTAPSTDPTLSTTYTYNIFGLTDVTQSGASGDQPRVRAFRYNSLGQLKGAYNPESGLVCYGTSLAGSVDSCSGSYDLNGNLLAKTDARGITTNFDYDSLDRLLHKTYANGATQSHTLSSCYAYGTSTSGNLNGRLIHEWTQDGSCPGAPSSGVWTRHSVIAYDALGGISQEERCNGNSCTQSRPHSFTYQSDLSGNLTQFSDGRQFFTFHTAYDGAGMASSLRSYRGTLSYQTLYTLTGSGPGGITGYLLGNNIAVQKTYDQYLRLQGLTAKAR
ncbi:RHS repeat domain-containing protein [Terriglobus albidus]|uniref:RHS repeat domain-containing protein n=1 Tax=Terriglobus albidus TaxID=1592106 RepID=UPI0021DFBEFC|nr:RHS repeat protein [Terriglobus albidus]